MTVHSDLPAGFAPGAVLAERFRILRFVAQGGMGEIYEASDLELGGTVALKVIRPEIASDPRVLQRFKREIALARKVTHPNVCRAFDVFRHDDPGPDGSTTFLAMEMLHGETLAARLRRAGPLAPAEALPLAEQMAAGLHAAHEAGIVHRDLKPGNVVLVAGDRGPRAVVTDFGLARSEDEARSSSSTAGLGMVGTSAYMSPEQVEGRTVTAASDIYSLGVVLYEMVTGVKPFQSDTALATAVLRLKEAPRPPRLHRPDIDARWEKAILRCLEVTPANRFASADELIAALRAPEQDAARVAGRASYGARSGYVVAASLAAAAALAGLAASASGRSVAAASAATAVPARRSVALLGFKNLSGRAESAWLSTALSEMLASELAAGEALRIIPGETVARMKVELSLAEAESLAPDTLARVRANLGTDLIVLGAYLAQGEKAGDRLRLDLRVQDAAAGEILASIAETGTEAELLDFVARGGSRLRERLGVEGPRAGARAAGPSYPSSPRAARLYAEGLARLRAFDAMAARDLLQKAVAADPVFPLAHAALAEAWSALGHDTEARRAAKAALDLSGRLPREERLTVEGRYAAIAAEWDKAVETYRVLWGFFPDNVEYGLRLAEAQSAAGRGHDALATVESLRKSTTDADPRIDLQEANAAAALSQVRRRRSAAARAARGGEARGAPLLVAEARLQEAAAIYLLGEPAAAIAAYEAAERAYARAGDRRGTAAALLGMGNSHLGQPNLAEAERLLQQALAISRDIGYQQGVSIALRRLGAVLSLKGDHQAAGAHYAKALAMDRARGDRAGIFHNLYNTAYTFHQRGDLTAARRFEDEALAVARDLRDLGKVAGLTNLMGWTRYDLGDLPGALDAYQEALALNRQLGLRGSAGQNLHGLASVWRLMGDQEGARRALEESLAIRRDYRSEGPETKVRVALAALVLDEGRAAEADAMLRAPLAYFQAAADRQEELIARVVQIRCLLAQGQLVEARASAERASALARTMQTREVGLSAAIAVAEVDAASGRVGPAIQSLERTLAETRRLRFGGLQFEARLALGQIELAHGRAAAGRARLAELGTEARASGVVLIARKADRHLRTAAMR